MPQVDVRQLPPQLVVRRLHLQPGQHVDRARRAQVARLHERLAPLEQSRGVAIHVGLTTSNWRTGPT